MDGGNEVTRDGWAKRAAGRQTAETDRLVLPLKELVKQYVQALRA